MEQETEDGGQRTGGSPVHLGLEAARYYAGFDDQPTAAQGGHSETEGVPEPGKIA
ncbi:hypothetical protein ACWGNM_34230 [Streptomyces sp. NPDC055796]